MEDQGGIKLSPLKQAFLAIEKLQARLDAMALAGTEPIAIIGIGCRFPGGANDLESFWRLLSKGIDAIVEIPPDRWNADAFYDPDPQASGKMTSKWGGFIENIDKFDPQFFGISPREAMEMDPQQRMMLEVSWEALENAGQAPDRLSGSQTAVFLGIASYEYSDLKMGTADLTGFDNYYISGCGPNMLSGRLSYILGLQGPSVTLDTACSSSLTAVHLACQSLRLKECDMAITGGTNEILQPHLMVAYSRAGLLARDGRCKTFDASADGLVRGEGCGVLILKRLSEALSAGDHIHALIRGSAVNQDGPSSGLSAPNGPAQTAVIREALRRGKVDPLSVGYVEAHGTGTPLGDPIEVQALGEALCKQRSKEKPLYIGSVKTNIGHLEGAAGVAGLIKAVLVLQHGEIPPNLNFRKPNPHINWDEIPVIVPTKAVPWNPEGGRRIAGVSSFGFGGTNVHVTLEQAVDHGHLPGGRSGEGARSDTGSERPLHLFTLSARDESTLRKLSGRYASYLAANPLLPLGDVCFTVNGGRSHFEHRAATVVDSVAQLQGRLQAFATQRSPEGLVYGRLDDVDAPGVTFLFPPQGSEYADMGRRLYETQPTFRRAMERCGDLLPSYLEKPLLSVLYPKDLGAPSLMDPVYAQLAVFAVEYALVELYRSWGIKPSLVMGQGIGEYVAAQVAGVLALEDALKLVAAHGGIPNAQPEVATSTELGTKDRISAATNAFQALASEIPYSRIRIPVISGCLGRLVKDEISKPDYWRNQIFRPARLSKALETLHEQGSTILVEIGPDTVLLPMAGETVLKPETIRVPTLRKNEDDWQAMLSSLSTLYVSGVSVDWTGFERDYPRKKTVLPSYPFNRKKYWTEDRRRLIFDKLGRREERGHSFLGSRVYSPLFRDRVFGTVYGGSFPSFLSDHRIHGLCLMPGAGYLAQSLLAAGEVFGHGYHSVEQLLFQEPMVFEEGQERSVHLVLSSEENGTASLRIFSLPSNGKGPEKEWTLHARGLIRMGGERSNDSNEVFDYAKVQNRYDRRVDIGKHFQGMEKVGAGLGPCFQGIEKLWHGKNETLAQLILPDRLLSEAGDYAVHPVILDTAIQAMGSILMNKNAYPSTFLPIEVESYHAYGNVGAAAWCQTAVRESIDQDTQVVTGDISLYDRSGRLSASLEGVHLRRTDRGALHHIMGRSYSDWLYEPAWRQVEREGVGECPLDRQAGTWLIFAGRDHVSDGLIKLIEEQGDSVSIVSEGPAFERKGNHYSINYKQPEDYRELFKDVDEHVHSVVFLWSAVPEEPSKMSVLDLERLMEERCGGVLHLVQAMIDTHETSPPRFWIVTRGATSVDGVNTFPGVVGGTLWGLGSAVAEEHPELLCTRIDLDPLDSNGQVKALFDEIRFPTREDQVAFRAGERYVARLVRYKELQQNQGDNSDRSRESQAGRELFRDDATYLITGGLGNLGRHVARWMLGKGARHLALMARSEPSREASEFLREMQLTGARILLARGDVGRKDDVVRIFDEIRSSMPPVSGVVHVAGILDDALLVKEGWEHFSRVLGPKVSGAWNLHTVTKDMALDFFIMFSSTASLLPNQGQSSYATANAFLNILAHHRHAVGLPALSINWGVWSGGGMAATVGDRERLRWSRQGVTLMEPTDALRALDQVLGKALSQVAILSVDWSSFFQYLQGARVPVMLSELAGGAIKPSEIPSRISQKPGLRQKLEEAAPRLRLAVLRRHLSEAAAKILKLDGPDILSTKKPLREAGLDSLMAVELRNVLSQDVGHNLPATLVFKYPTIEALTEYFAAEVFSLGGLVERGTASRTGEDTQEDFEGLESLSDEEISNLLDDELNSLPEELRDGKGDLDD